MYFAFTSIVIILFGTGLMGTASICLAQDSPWTSKKDMPTGRSALSASVVNSKIYVMGGQATGNGSGSPASPELEVYDPATDNWDTTKTDMPMGRNSFASGVVNGKIYAIGGQSVAVTTAESSVMEYDPQTDTWDTTKTKMPTPRVGLSTSVVNEKIYVIGGWNFSSPTFKRDVWEYNPLTDTWDTTKTDMPTARGYLSTSVIDGKIYAFGGYANGPAFKTVEMYDPVTDTWDTKADMPAGRIYLKTSSVDSLIYIFGGSTNPYDPPMSDVWEYNPALDSYKVVSPMPTGLVHASSGEVNGNIYIIGGSVTPWIFQPGSTVFEYNPHNDLLRLVKNFIVDMSYAIPGTDNVLITTKINNPAGITLFAEIEAPDQTPVDSLQLFDDGNHNDGSTGDSLFANSWPVPPVEERNYYIDLHVTRIEAETVVNHLNNMALFTTIGPLVVEDYVITSNDTVPNPGDQIRFKLELRNNGLTETAGNINAVISTTDSCISKIIANRANYGDIPAGESVIPASDFQYYSVEINLICPGNSDVWFNVDIYSDGNIFWSDSFAFHIDKATAIPDEKNFLPDKYALHQNYPNPFNPTTKIKYQIPELNFVTLKVYDVLGSNVATLVNEEKPMGNYEIEFNGNELTSGVYFYQLQVGSPSAGSGQSFVETKKMVLLR
jgi:N-acetylneuraminic acid mutarotase